MQRNSPLVVKWVSFIPFNWSFAFIIKLAVFFWCFAVSLSCRFKAAELFVDF